MSGVGGVEPVKYVTILDLKERWLKKKQKEAEEEERKKKEVEELRREESEKKKVFKSLNELKIGNQKDNRNEARSAGGDRLRFNGRGRGRGRRWNRVKAVDSVEDEVRYGSVDCRSDNWMDSDLHTDGSGEEMNVYRKNDLGVDDARISGDERAKFSGGRRKGKRYLRKGRVSDVTENVDVVDEKSGGEKMKGVGIVGDEMVTRINCPCHSRSENQGSGGFWVCRYIEPGSGAEFQGCDDVKGDLVDAAGKKSGNKVLLNTHKLHGKVRKKKIVEREREDTMRVTADYSRVVNHDDELRKDWEQQEKKVMIEGVKDEVVMTQMQKESMGVDKDSRSVMNSGGRGSSCQKNSMKLHSDTAGPSIGVEEHPKSSAATERHTKHKGKIRARGNIVNGRNIYDTGKFMAEENFVSLAMEYVKKDDMHVNSSCEKMVDEVGPRHNNYDLTSKLEYMEPTDLLERPGSSVETEMLRNHGDNFRDRGYGIYPGKNPVKNRHQSGNIFAKVGNTNSGKFNDRMKGTQMEKRGFMWVKKGEASGVNAGSKH